jgi:hypothetical protein
MKFVTFRQSQIDVAAIGDANGGNSERNAEALDPHIKGNVGQ